MSMRRSGLALSLVCLLVGAGCGHGAKPAVARGGTSGSRELVVGSDVSYAPIEFFREGTQQVEGLDYELAQAIGAKLGRPVRFVNSTFDGLIPALRSRRFDVVMSAMSDTKERQGAGVDFVDYFNAGTAILVRRGNPNGIHALDGLCGSAVAGGVGAASALLGRLARG
jgi:polar amino acid transport system substrate-binding protein